MGPLDQDIVAAVDLGSNSFHMVIAREVEGQPVVIDRLRERVALAEGLRPNGTLAPKVQTRALRCLERFGQRLSEVADSRCRAVGTATFRKARGAEDFHSLAEHALGREIEILGGREEARLIYLGVSHTLPGGSEKRLVIDIGGASTECIVGQRFESLLEESLAMGCVTFTRRFFPEGRLTSKAFKRARLEAELQLEPIEAAYERAGWEVAVGSSGTITAVATILQQQGWTHGHVTRAGLESLRASLIESESVDRIELQGLKADRRPVLGAGVAILEGLFRTFGIETLDASPGALREGLLYDLLGRIHQEDVRGSSVVAFGARLGIDEMQAARVMGTATALYDQVAEEWGMGPHHRDLLSWAAWLHEVGLSVSFSGFHRHGAYLLEHADLTGFSRDEQARVAALVRQHRRKLRLELLEDFSPTVAVDLERLLVLLRLGVALHRSHRQQDVPVPDARVSRSGERLTLTFEEGWLEAHPLTRVDLESECELWAQAGFELRVR